MESLEEAGLLYAVKAKGFQEKFGAKFVMNNGDICDFNFSENFTEGYTWTWQVPRAEFDKTLADAREAKGFPSIMKQKSLTFKFGRMNLRSQPSVIWMEPKSKLKRSLLSMEVAMDESYQGCFIWRNQVHCQPDKPNSHIL